MNPISDTHPLVSICIPTFNQTEYLKMTLDSVFIQLEVDFEVIVSDDSTTEDVSLLVEEYKKEGKAIRYYRNKPNLGSPANWNFAMKQAKGDFIKILHHDDVFTSKYALKKFLTLVKQNEHSHCFVICASTCFNHKFQKTFNNIPSGEAIQNISCHPYTLCGGNIFGAPSVTLIPNNIDLHYDTNLIWLVDIEFYLHLFYAQGFEVIYTDEPLICTHQDDHNITNSCINNYALNLFEYSAIYKKYKSHLNWIQKIKFLFIIINNLRAFKKDNIFKILIQIQKHKKKLYGKK